MKLATFDDMELGNMMFGNSRGTYVVVPREDYQDAFCEFLYANGWDGHAIRTDDLVPDPYEFENDTFVVRAYYWGEDEAIAELPNFVYKPTGLEISWYKYPMRDAYSNQDVSLEEFKDILDACARSMDRHAKSGDAHD